MDGELENSMVVPGTKITALSISSAGTVVAGSDDGSVHIWDANGQSVAKFFIAHAAVTDILLQGKFFVLFNRCNFSRCDCCDVM